MNYNVFVGSFSPNKLNNNGHKLEGVNWAPIWETLLCGQELKIHLFQTIDIQ